jgi:hypothetical protein
MAKTMEGEPLQVILTTAGVNYCFKFYDDAKTASSQQPTTPTRKIAINVKLCSCRETFGVNAPEQAS